MGIHAILNERDDLKRSAINIQIPAMISGMKIADSQAAALR